MDNKVYGGFGPFRYELTGSSFYTISQIAQANKALGHHWFEPATKRFFASRVLSDVYQTSQNGVGAYFVSSERCNLSGESRLYTVRRALSNGAIETVGAFQAYDTARQAKAAAKRFAALKVKPEVNQ
jgi:hypothetical protein